MRRDLAARRAAALALDPEAALVSEAARVLGGGWDAVLRSRPA